MQELKFEPKFADSLRGAQLSVKMRKKFTRESSICEHAPVRAQ